MTDQIQLHLENKHCVKLTRRVADGQFETSSGYILAYSKELILIQETKDFLIDGFCIFPLQHIVKVKYNRADRYFDKMMRSEKISDEVRIKYNISLESWQIAFKTLKKNNLPIIVECEADDVDDDAFSIGSINKTGAKSLQINHFDATGYWDDEPTKIAYSSISKVDFDSQYINIFSKYLRKRKHK